MSEYKKAGVDIEAGADAVKKIRRMVSSTFRREVIGDIGAFAGLFKLNFKKYKNPVLVSATDGVGTKLIIVQKINKHDTVGIDLVAMCVNDIIACGAEPLFFLDYIATGKIIPQKIAEIVKGVVKGCREANCSLIGGETAEMPGIYGRNEYDLVGFSVGMVERDKIIDGAKIKEGDVIIGLASSGLHSNGYSLVRKVFLGKERITLQKILPGLKKELWKELLIPTRIYVKPILKLLGKIEIHGLAHITGGGFYDNISRILPKDYNAIIHSENWKVPPIFRIIQEKGKVARDEMFRVFNMGVGMTMIIPPGEKNKVISSLRRDGYKSCIIGEITKGKREVMIL